MKKKYKNLETVAKKFTELMIARIREVEKDWTKPWFPVIRKNFFPRNYCGRRYSGGNTIMLLFHLMFTGYRTPVFMTFKQAGEIGLNVLKGEAGFPVYHFNYLYIHQTTKEKISEKEYRELSEAAKNDYFLFPAPKYYWVFNLEQTNFKEKYPDEWLELLLYYEEELKLNKDEMFCYPLLDDVFDNQKWVCPIEFKISDRAYYSPGQDEICMPLKQQFRAGGEFYSTALHEMAHSTGSVKRLKRIKEGAGKNTSDYAREELIAELASALLGYYMGIESAIRDDHAAYLKHWMERIGSDPDYLLDVLSDVVKAVGYIMEKINFEIPGENTVSITEDGKKEKTSVSQPAETEDVLVVID